MKSIRTALLSLVVMLCAGSAYAQVSKEKVPLCTGAGVCVAGITVNWKLGARAEYALDDDTGCTATATATYAIFGTNTGGTIPHLVTTLSNATVTSVSLEPAVWFPSFTVVPSGIAGCTSLVISIWVTPANP